MTKKKLKGTYFLSIFEPKTIKEAINDEDWVSAMNEEIEKLKGTKHAHS